MKKYAFPLARLYWKIFRPKTFGVKAVVVRKDNPSTVLLVQHSYGDELLWNLPGGGFNPKKETSKKAIARELLEELSCTISSLLEIGQYHTDTEGKRDTVIIYFATIESLGTVQVSEIQTTRWCSFEEIQSMPDVARIARYGLNLYRKHLSSQA